jgi:hypothetical protein
MKTAKILLWDEIDHDHGVLCPTPKTLPQEYITQLPTLASIQEVSTLPFQRRKYLGEKKMFAKVLPTS